VRLGLWRSESLGLMKQVVYRLHYLAVAQPSVSEHWRNLTSLCLNWGNISIVVLSFQVWWRLHGDNSSERRATRHRASAAVHGWNICQLTAAWTSSERAALPAAGYWCDTGTDLQPHGTGSGTVQRWRLCCQPDDSWSGSTRYRNGTVELIIGDWEPGTGVWLKMGGIWHIHSVGSRPSDHYFHRVCLFVCLFVCAEFFSAVFDPI